MYEYLIFDLDGTISDPKEGIVKSLNYALSANGYDTKDSKDIETTQDGEKDENSVHLYLVAHQFWFKKILHRHGKQDIKNSQSNPFKYGTLDYKDNGGWP